MYGKSSHEFPEKVKETEIVTTLNEHLARYLNEQNIVGMEIMQTCGVSIDIGLMVSIDTVGQRACFNQV